MENFYLGCFLVMVAIWRVSLSSDNSNCLNKDDLDMKDVFSISFDIIPLIRHLCFEIVRKVQISAEKLITNYKPHPLPQQSWDSKLDSKLSDIQNPLVSNIILCWRRSWKMTQTTVTEMPGTKLAFAIKSLLMLVYRHRLPCSVYWWFLLNKSLHDITQRNPQSHISHRNTQSPRQILTFQMFKIRVQGFVKCKFWVN